MQKHKNADIPLPRVEDFLAHLRGVRRYSQHTLAAYDNDLRQCAAFLKEQHGLSLEQATKGALRAFVLTSIAKKMQPRTINRKIAALKSFYVYLLRQDPTRKENPALSLKALKTPATLPAFLKEEDVHTLFDKMPFEDNYAGRRDKLVLLLLYGAGLRRAELLALQEQDLDLSRATLRVLGKGQKVRALPLPAPLCEEAKAYLEVKRQHFPQPATSYFFLDDTGKPLYPMWLYRHVHKYLSHATQLQKRSPHVLRHTYATHLLNRGADLYAIKELLGHSSLAATQVYTHVTLQKIKTIYKQAHPKA